MQRLTKSLCVLCVSLAVVSWARQDPSSASTPQNQAPPEAKQSASQDAPPPPASPSETPAQVEKSAPQGGTEAKPAPKSTATKASSRKRRSRKQAEDVTNHGETRRVVIHRGGVSEPATQIIPGMSAEESNRERQQTQDLLAAVESDLKKLAARSLNSGQQETVSQIQHYTDVARTALQEGDIQRAHTLARKAQLLSDDLVKH